MIFYLNDVEIIKTLKSYKNLKKATKSTRRMPWYMEAMKDVVSCDKLRGGAHNC